MNAYGVAKPIPANGRAPKMGPVVSGKTKADNNRYCGPAVISSVTGCTTGEAAYLIREINNRKKVTGTHETDLFRVLKTFGIGVRQIQRWPDDQRPTLTAWLKETHGTRAGRVFLISAGHHWQLVSGNKFVCGITRKVVGLKHDRVKRRARVREVWELVLTGDKAVKPSLHPRLIARDKRKKAKATPRNHFAKLARAHGFTFKVDSDCYLDTSPFEGFPKGFHTFHYNWDESLERLEYCLRNPEVVDECGYYSE